MFQVIFNSEHDALPVTHFQIPYFSLCLARLIFLIAFLKNEVFNFDIISIWFVIDHVFHFIAKLQSLFNAKLNQYFLIFM